MRNHWRPMLLILALAIAAQPSFADDLDELRKLRDTTIALVNALVDQGVLTRAKADEIIAQAQQSAAKPAAAGAAAAPAPKAATAAPNTMPGLPATTEPATPVVRVPYIPESLKEEIRDQVKGEIVAEAKSERWGEPGAFPEWLRHFTWSGDIRLRAEADRFPSSGRPNLSADQLQAFGVNVSNSTEADDRYRIRARFGFEATVADTVTVGMRLATGGVGSGGNPASENQTLGTYEARSTVGFDRAYLQYRPVSWLSFTGGRIGNPFYSPTTLIWANDLSLEGLVAHAAPEFGPHATWFTTVGVLPILQNDPTPLSSAPSKWLYAYQTGLDWRVTETGHWSLAAALYDYRHIEGILNPTLVSTAYSATAAPFRQTGNTVFDINYFVDTGTSSTLYGLASRFHELNLSTTLDLAAIGPTHVILDGDWVKNLGFNQGEIFQRTGFNVLPETKGWQTRLMVGYPSMQQKHAWQAWLGYRYVERDATVDAFTDSDFHLGGTDAKGYYLGGSWSFEKNSFLSLRWFSAKEISGIQLAGQDNNPVAAGGLPFAVDVLQFDVNAAF